MPARKTDVDVNIDDRELQRSIKGLLREFQDLRKSLLRPLLYPKTMEANREWYDSEGSGTWLPNTSRAYLKWKAKHYPGQGLLHMTGGLYGSIASRGGAAGFRKASFFPRRLYVKFSHPLAHLYQTGWNGKGGSGYARPVMDPEGPIMADALTDAMRLWRDSVVESAWAGGKLSVTGVKRATATRTMGRAGTRVRIG